MGNDSSPAKIKQLRVLILTNLNRLYPTALQVDTLYRVICGFDESYDFTLLQKDLIYLQQKGYVDFIDDLLGGADSFRKKCVGLTAEGKEIADRTQRDNALEI